jgi:uncharacterized membrane protein
MSKVRRAPPAPENVQHVQVVQAEFSGPLPPPSMLAHYNDIIVDGADRMMGLVERQSAHRIEMEKLAAERELELSRSRAKLATTGQQSGLAITLVIVASTVWLAANGHTVVASVLGSTSLCTVAAIFAIGRRSEKPVEQERAPSANKAVQPQTQDRRSGDSSSNGP